DRERFLDALAAIEGVYVPSRYVVVYAPDGGVGEVRPLGAAPAIVTKRRLRNVNAFETVDAVKTPNAEYGHMALLEVGKGFGRGCRLCREGQVYRPVRHRSVDALRETVARIAASGEKRVGLVGACVSDYPWIGELLKVVEDNGLELSISSIRADSLTDDLVAALARGGHRTLTIAPEAGTERLRRAIRNAITDEQVLAACDLVRAHGIPNLKTYFMIGQPTETLEDVEAIPRLAERMLERLRVPDPRARPFGRLTLSISSFVPKPWTPFQWAPFDGAASLQAKLEIVKHGVRRFSNVRVLHENARRPRSPSPRERRDARRRHLRSSPQEPSRLGHRSVQPALSVLHARGGLRLAPARGDPPLRGDRRARRRLRGSRRGQDQSHGGRAAAAARPAAPDPPPRRQGAPAR